MPFSVLRTWGLGLVGWAMLGIAAYCLWEWADGVDPAPVRIVSRDPARGETHTLHDQGDQRQRDTGDDDHIHERDRIAHQIATGWRNLLREELLWNTIRGEAESATPPSGARAVSPTRSCTRPTHRTHYPAKPKAEVSGFAAKFGKLRNCDTGRRKEPGIREAPL